jgi:hypothetical protein
MSTIQSGSEASSFITNVREAYGDYWEKVKNTEAYILHGETPFDDEELAEDGQEWVPNYNYGKGRAEVEQGVINNQGDIYRSFAFINVEFENYNKAIHKKDIHAFLLDDYIKGVIKRILSFSLANCLEEDERVHPWISQIEYHSFTFGYCPILRHDWSYLGDPVPLTSIGFQDRTKIGELRDFVIFDVVKVDDIYAEYTRNKDRDKKRVEYCGEVYHIYPNGWIEEGMLDVFKTKINLLNLDEDYEPFTKDSRKRRLVVESWDHINEFIGRKGINYLSYNSTNIFIAKIFNWEDSNTYTESYAIIDSNEEGDVGVETFTSARQFLLYQKVRKRKRSSEIITLVKEFGISNDCYITSLRGAGKFIAEEALRYDTKRNTIEAKLILSGSPFFQAMNSLSGKAGKIKVAHGYTIVDDGMQIIEKQPNQDVNAHISSLMMENNEYEKRVYHINPRMDLSSRPTTQEVNTKSSEVSNLKRSKMPIKLADYSRLFTECLFDLVTKKYENDENKIVQDKFFEYVQHYLLKYSIEMTKEQIIDVVKTVKCVSLLPALGDIQAIREAMEVVGNSEQRKMLSVMYLLALGFSRKEAWEYVDVEDYGDHVDKAASENQMFYTTSEVPSGKHQDPTTHLNTHFAKADRVLKGVVGGEDPVKAFNWITNCLINTAKHIEQIQTNPFYKKQYKQFLKVQSYFEGKAKALARAVEQLKQQEQQRAQQNVEGQQQAQQQQGIDPKLAEELRRDEIKMMEKIRRTDMLTESAMQRKQEMFELQKELNKKATDSNIEMQREFANMQKELALLKESVKLANQ